VTRDFVRVQADLAQRQSLPLDAKIAMSRKRIREWADAWDGDVFVAFSGGKDSTALLHLVRSVLGPDVPAVFYQTGVEFPEMTPFVKSFPNVTIRRAKMGWGRVLREHGYPVVSKQVSHCIDIFQRANERNAASRHFYLTGEKRDGTTARVLLAKKWRFLINAPFKISEKCCEILKKNPAAEYEKETGRKPLIGTLAEESRMRLWKAGSCNVFTGKHPKSKPFSFWTGQDVLEYIVAEKLPVCSVYGEIVREADGRLATTGEDRTGCVGCMFGADRVGRDGLTRFQRLAITHPRLWHAYIYGLKLGPVLDFIGAPYVPPADRLVQIGKPRDDAAWLFDEE
jgi:3'-phosphoadenosine 5'-phosphosulfate sulfotransferase (PAPS reductase)/FAD synthetase